ncbi:MAG: amino acid permease [Acidimicrobiales bacterium]|nr:amino acid permease [Hyphomonadaceae bacterium]RZV43163.1 MAG: amino acid permease [Acidimicrobiales bacterium]
MSIKDSTSSKAKLQRRLTLPLLVLYGLGVTVGAGIYVLVGLTAAEAGVYAPVSFLVAALVVSFTGFSYAELSTRFPISAGEAAYVRNGFKAKWLALVVGLLVAASGVVSAAAVSIGASAYLTQLLSLPPMFLTVVLILILGLAAAWGILESVSVAAVLTLIEIGGLAFVIYFAFQLKPDLLVGVPELIPPLTMEAWTGISAAGLLAFFAFIGFEDLANVAEEAKNPRRNMPWSIVLTLLIATTIYLAVVSVVVLSVPMSDLQKSASPLSLVFVNAGPAIQNSFIIVAGIATVNGVLIQMIMASRVLYGLANQNQLPAQLAKVSPLTNTPLVATATVVAIILALVLFFPIERLAEMTSQIALTVFAFVNLALIRIKRNETKKTEDFYTVPIWVPIAGFITCLIMLASGFI